LFAQREVENYKNSLARTQRESKQIEFTAENIEKQYLRELDLKEKKILELAGLRSELQKSLEKLIKENKEYITKITECENKLFDTERDQSEKTARFEREILGLKVKLDSAEAQLAEEKAKPSSQIAVEEEKIKTLTSLLREQKQQIVTFQRIVQDLEDKKARLEEELASAHTTISEKHSKLTYYKDTLRKMKSKCDSQK
jgi:chromosome segregation ATPase